MENIDLSTWDRFEIFKFFENISNPFYSVTFNQNVTKLKKFSKQNGISFYYALIWLCTEAVNSVSDFLVGSENGELVMYDRREPSFTDITPGKTCFHITTMRAGEGIIDFCRTAKETSRNQTCFIDSAKESDALIYYSCLPWVELTGLTNERNFDAMDSVPRIAWGKYFERDGELIVGISVEINHKFIDGYHIGKFHEKLSELIENLEVEY